MMINKFVGSLCIAASVFTLAACGGDKASTDKATASNEPQAVVYRIGVCPGPYGKMIEEGISPSLAAKNIKVEIIEFTDYVQPDLALDGGDLDANLMQHSAYLDGMIENQGLKLKAAIDVPTLGLGIFSQKVTSFDELKAGDKVALPNDAVNLARALRVARDVGLITLKQESDDQKASIGDIDTNKYGLEFIAMEAAQISRSFDSIALGFVPGNYAIAANLDYSKALGVEVVQPNIRNVIAVRENNFDTVGKELKSIVESQAFKDAINNNSYYDGFTRPDWWSK